MLGQVTDEDLAALYQACTVFCYPSLYEGFGLPLLEAMASGAACVTSSVSSLPEVGGDAVVYVEPTSVDEIRTALEGLLASEQRRTELGTAARRRAAGFTWDRTAADTLDSLLLDSPIAKTQDECNALVSPRSSSSPSHRWSAGAAVSASSDAARSPRILVFTKTTAFRHASIPVALRAVRDLGQRNGLVVDATEDARRVYLVESRALQSGGLSPHDRRRLERWPAGRLRTLHSRGRRLRRRPFGG